MKNNSNCRLSLPKGTSFYKNFATAEPGSIERKLFEEKVDKDEPLKSTKQYLNEVIEKNNHAFFFISSYVEGQEQFVCDVS